MRRPNLFLPIETRGSLRVETPSGEHFDLVADGSCLRADLREFSDLNGLAPRSWLARRRLVARAARLLTTFGLRLDLGVAKQHTIVIGAGARPSLVARLLGLGPVEISLASVAALARHS